MPISPHHTLSRSERIQICVRTRPRRRSIRRNNPKNKPSYVVKSNIRRYNFQDLIARRLEAALRDALADTPIILLTGARQTGKSTLLRSLHLPDTRIVNLDDLATLESITRNAQIFLRSVTERHVIFDEVQRPTSLLLPLKEDVDQNRVAGRFLLTGSANVLLLPNVADTLAGRIEILNLWPLTQGEIRGTAHCFVESIFGDAPFGQVEPCSQQELAKILTTGGYPEVVTRPARRRVAWFAAYLQTLLQRDVTDLSRIEGMTKLPNLLAILASRVGGLINVADLSRSLGLSAPTLARYLTLLRAIFLIIDLPPWYVNRSNRLVKAPKTFMNDTGILCHLLDISEGDLTSSRRDMGAILENFVVMELVKQRTWCSRPPQLFHFRTHAGYEVDIVASRGRRLVGIEVKSSSAVQSRDFNGLRYLKNTYAEEFHRGCILYNGTETFEFEENLWALPMSTLWLSPVSRNS